MDGDCDDRDDDETQILRGRRGDDFCDCFEAQMIKKLVHTTLMNNIQRK